LRAECFIVSTLAREWQVGTPSVKPTGDQILAGGAA
jgi:hypothetical protein